MELKPTLNRRIFLGSIGAAGLAAATAACSNSDPLKEGSGDGAAKDKAGGPIVIGSQAYYSNEIIAELFAQVLENAGLKVQRQYQIGQREVYMKELESGKVDLIPEYTGALLQYYDKEATSASPEEIFSALKGALPNGLEALPFSKATDQDSYCVTETFSKDNSVTSLADLGSLKKSLKIAGNSEIETRPFGPEGLKKAYGVDSTVVPVEDSGGPLTVKAITDGTADLANVYTASPLIKDSKLVVLEDPKSLFLPQNVTPLVTAAVKDQKFRDALKKVTDALTTEELIALNAKSVNDQAKSADIAKAWLKDKGIVG